MLGVEKWSVGILGSENAGSESVGSESAGRENLLSENFGSLPRQSAR